MTDETDKRWILVSDGTPQMLYVGQTDKSAAEIVEDRTNNKMLKLENCRVMRTLIIPAPDGVNQSNMLLPNSIARRGMTTYVLPMAFFWPDEDEDTMAALADQLGKCASAELKHRVKKAGLITPDGMRLP